MRTPFDRVRHALMFEIFALLLAVPGGMLLFGLEMKDMGVIALGGATIATLWNYVYNWLFDHAMARWRGDTRKTPLIRVGHAILFEVGILLLLLPFIAWWLGISLWQALVMDVGMAIFYVVYAFVFNWAYDRIFPAPGWAQEAGSAASQAAS